MTDTVDNEEQVEQGFLGADRAREGGRHRHGLLERRGRRGQERVEHEGVAHEELVLVLAHHRPPGARPAPPVNALERIARSVVAQGGELLRVSDGRRQRDAAALEATSAAQRQRRQRVAAGDGTMRSARMSPSGSRRASELPVSASRPRRRGVSVRRAST